MEGEWDVEQAAILIVKKMKKGLKIIMNFLHFGRLLGLDAGNEDFYHHDKNSCVQSFGRFITTPECRENLHFVVTFSQVCD